MSLEAASSAAVQAILDDPDRAESVLAAYMIESAAASSPLLSEMLAVAAIPREFDASILASLLGTAEDDPAFVQAFRDLTAYPVVDRRSESLWALHAAVRSALLDYWRRSSESTDQFNTHLATLSQLYLERYDRARRAADGLEQLSDVLGAVNAERERLLADAVEDQWIRAAVEVVHTELRRSYDLGWRCMVQRYNELEGHQKTRLCDLLTRSWTADASIVEPSRHAVHAAWSTYFQARTARRRRDCGTALRLLDGIVDPNAIDLRFAAWYHSERGRTLRALCRFQEALAAVDREIGIHEQFHVDDRNSSLPLSDKARLHAQLWEVEAEIESNREALRRAESYSTPAMQIRARLDLAESLHAGGLQTDWATELFQALWQARAMLGDAPDFYLQLTNFDGAAAAIELLGPTSSRLLAVLVEQHAQLSRGGAEGRLDRLLLSARAYVDGGDAERAQRDYAEARRLAENEIPGRLAEVTALEAERAAALGRPVWGAENNLALLSRVDMADDVWRRARALTHAAADLLFAGEHARSRQCIDEAQPIWEGMGHRHGVGWVRALRGELLRRSGDFEGARRELEAADTGPARGYERDALECRARLARDVGDHAEAFTYALQAANVARAVGNLTEAVESLTLAVDSLVRARRYAEASEINAAVGREVQALHAFAQWRPDLTTSRADEQAGRAVWILVHGVGPVRARARSAVAHLDDAIGLDGSVWWYWVEAAMAEAAGGRLREARARLDQAVRRADVGPMKSALEQIQARLAAGDLPAVTNR